MIDRVNWVSLLVGYALVGYGGDDVAGLVAAKLGPNDVTIRHAAHVDVVVDVEPLVQVPVDVRQTSCPYELERVVSAAATEAERLRLDVGSGELRVEGRYGLTEVRGTARVCASDEAYLDDLQVTLDRSGDDLVLTAHYPDRSGRRSWRGNDVARIDLVVEVPVSMAVDIEDSSGSMEVGGTGALRIDDGSGSITLRGINGPVRIEDGSGGVRVEDVAGDVDVDDSSGGIDVRDVEGTVRIRDSSGSIDVAEVEVDVVIERDGSGSIRVDEVGGDFVVLQDGSGGIRHSGVRGRVDIPRDERRRRRRG